MNIFHDINFSSTPKYVTLPVMVVITVQIFVHLVLWLFIRILIKFHVVLNIQMPNWLYFRLPREFPPLFVTLNFVSFLALHAHESQHFEAFMRTFKADKLKSLQLFASCTEDFEFTSLDDL